MRELENLRRLLVTARELAGMYPTSSISNIVQQLESRIKYHVDNKKMPK